jgi:hypothetical protein
MSLKDWTPKVAALVAIGFAIWILFVECITLFWRHQFQAATSLLALGMLSTLIFFRKPKVRFCHDCSIDLAGLRRPRGPLSSEAGGNSHDDRIRGFALVISCVGSGRYPYLKRKDWKVFFDGYPE